MSDWKPPTLKEILSGKSRIARIEEESEWQKKGDIRAELQKRPEEDWKELPIVVWVDYGQGERKGQYSISGPLMGVRFEGHRWEYTVKVVKSEQQEDGTWTESFRNVVCRDNRIYLLEKTGPLTNSLIKNYNLGVIEQLDAKSTAKASFERERQHALENTQDERIRAFIANTIYSPPPHRKETDPARRFRVMHELTIAYLEGGTLNNNRDNLSFDIRINGASQLMFPITILLSLVHHQLFWCLQHA